MCVTWVCSLLLALVGATANGLDTNLQTFVQAAVPQGGIFFSGAVQTNEATYNLFVLEQDERRGVMVVANNSAAQFTASPQILFADTSFDVASDLGLIPSDVSLQLFALLGNTAPNLESIAGQRSGLKTSILWARRSTPFYFPSPDSPSGLTALRNSPRA